MALRRLPYGLGIKSILGGPSGIAMRDWRYFDGVKYFVICNTGSYLTYNDWFLPSKDELNTIRTNLYLTGIGGISVNTYWSSSEHDATASYCQVMLTGAAGWSVKNTSFYVRAIRSFTSTTVYALGDVGPAGGWIFYRNGNDYLEAAPTDQSNSHSWSNIINIEIGVTAQGTAIGTGQANTTAIMAQVGHTDSAANLCDDYINTAISVKTCVRRGIIEGYGYTDKTLTSTGFAGTEGVDWENIGKVLIPATNGIMTEDDMYIITEDDYYMILE